MWAWIWIAVALLVNGLIFRWLGGFGAAGEAMERWGGHSARRWARRRGIQGRQYLRPGGHSAARRR